MKDVLIENMDYVIREIDLPAGQHGLCMMDEDDRANVYIRSMDELPRKMAAADHEIRHFAFEDFYLPEQVAEEVNRTREKDVSIEVVESEDAQGDTILKLKLA